MTTKIVNKQRLAAIVSIAATLGLAGPVQGQERTDTVPAAGFYGGISLRDRGTDGVGLNVGAATSAWTKFAIPTVDDTAARALAFGGYRWRNEVAVEASFSSSDKYALRPADAPAGRGGVALGVGSGAAGLTDLQSRSWNVDVYTSWAFYKTLALYGRLGYGQAEAAPVVGNPSLTSGVDPRRLRDGVNYGVGLRYDMNTDLGLRLEYARFGRFGVEAATVLPESDQVTFGVQLRF